MKSPTGRYCRRYGSPRTLEHFQFRDQAKDQEELSGEMTDVALYLLQLASVTGIDLERAILEKIEINKAREWNDE